MSSSSWTGPPSPRWVHDLAGLERGPLVALDPDGDGEQTGQEGNGLDTLFDGVVEYEDGTPATTSQMAKDVVEFLNWSAEPGHSNTYHWVRNAKKTILWACRYVPVPGK
jgi:hypothetical protein